MNGEFIFYGCPGGYPYTCSYGKFGTSCDPLENSCPQDMFLDFSGFLGMPPAVGFIMQTAELLLSGMVSIPGGWDCRGPFVILPEDQDPAPWVATGCSPEERPTITIRCDDLL